MKLVSYILTLPVRVLIATIFVIVIVAIGLIWGVRMVSNNPDEPSPATTVEAGTPQVLPASPTTQILPAVSPTPLPNVPPATPTPMSQIVPTPIPAGLTEEIVQSGEGLYMICRRHCLGRWPPDDDALTTYAQGVAELNGLSWPDAALSPGQSLRMQPCPP
ncbi:MAG: hypothetical protein GY832_43485 [Chloroflexi bacterium]|nr:hypothetical protein [Chloroflexota bacterium]